jgi:arylsulfatase A-like enzyme
MRTDRVFLALVGLLLAVISRVRADAAPPNVVLVMTDDQGYGDFGCHGNPIIQTPQVDALRAESVRLTDFHVDPSCAPTRSALLTGKYSVRAGVWDTSSGRQILRRDEVTMGDVFRENGYRTAIFGKWHLGHNYPYLPEYRGFDESLVHYSGGVGQLPDHPGNDYYDDTYYRSGKPEKVKGYCGDVWFREGLRFIEENRTRPFFLYLSTNTPHGPYRVPEKYSKPYLDRGVPEQRAKFYGMCANIDENLGRLRQRLRELELEDNTILIFMTDNGGTAGLQLSAKYHGFVTSGYNAGMRGAKQSMYEGGHRVPCFIHWPQGGIGGAASRDIDVLTAHFDLLPTLIDLCGMKLTEKIQFDGISLTKLLRGGATADWPERTLVAAVNRNQDPPKWYRVAILTERWRLVNGDELYDIVADPGQRKDVAAEHPDVIAHLKEWYEGYWKHVSKRFDEFARLVVGAPEANPTMLCSHDLLEDSKQLAVDVVRTGRYEVTLSNDHPANQRSLSAARAQLKIGDLDLRKNAAPDATTISFEARLEKGPTFVEAWFMGSADDKPRRTPFYVFRYLGS